MPDLAALAKLTRARDADAIMARSYSLTKSEREALEVVEAMQGGEDGEA